MRRSVNSDVDIHEALTDFVDVVDGIGKMTEVSTFAVVFGIPVIGEFNLCILIAGRREKYQGETSLFALVTIKFLQAQLVAIEIQRFFSNR